MGFLGLIGFRVFRVFGFLGFWVFGFLGFWVFGFLGFWVFGFLGFWVFGFLGFWVFVFLGFCVFGFLCFCVFGCLGFWVFGFLGFGFKGFYGVQGLGRPEAQKQTLQFRKNPPSLDPKLRTPRVIDPEARVSCCICIYTYVHTRMDTVFIKTLFQGFRIDVHLV